MGDNFKDYMVQQEREKDESPTSRGNRREPMEMSVMQMIWKLLKLRLKCGNVPVKTWVQYQGFCNLYEPQVEEHIYGMDKFISIY